MNTNATGVSHSTDVDNWLRLVEQALEMEPHTLRSGDVLTSISKWDSLAVIQYLAMIDGQFGVTVRYEQIASCTTLDELFNATPLS